MASTFNPKAAHYELQLQAALCRGAWAEDQPGLTPNGSTMSWGELLRKYQKHCKASEVATAAQQTQALSLLLLSTSRMDKSASLTPASLDGDMDPPSDLSSLGGECLLQEERREDATAGLRFLKASKNDEASVQLTTAYYEYSLGNPRECIAMMTGLDLDSINQIRHVQAASTSLSVPSSATGSLGSSSGAMTLEAALSRSGTIASSIGSAVAVSRKLEGEIGEGKVWAVIERIRARCLEGMSHETLHELPQALSSYDAGIPLLDLLALTKVTPTGKVKTDSFNKYRELWRWSERLLRRASIVAARIRSISDTLRYLHIYQFYSQHWLPTFRSSQRHIIATLHMRALCLLPPSVSAPNSPLGSLAAWREESKQIANDLKWVLDATTIFPRAGEINHKVLDFVDLCVAVWERGGEPEEETGWIIDLLWWATRLTFHSHRIMRHLTRLLRARQAHSEAKRTFKLYVQLVSKARQTSASEISRQLKRRNMDHPAAHPAEEEDEEPALDLEEDADDDRTFVETLVWGIEMLAKSSADYEDAKELSEIAKTAQTVVESPKLCEDGQLLAKVFRALGISSSSLALREPDPKLRLTHQQAAIAHYTKSTQLDPSSASTFYHLAYAQADTRDIAAAVISARQCVEKNTSELRYWHLLGLLLTAQGDMSGAMVVLQLGIENAEDCDEGDPNDDQTIEATNQAPSHAVHPKDYAPGESQAASVPSRSESSSSAVGTPTLNGNFNDIAPEAPSNASTALPRQLESLMPSTMVLPPASTLHAPIPDTLPMSKASKFEASLQLRITQLAITELTEGTESANLKWPELFAFFSDHCGGTTHLASSYGSVPTEQTASIARSEDHIPVSDGPAFDPSGLPLPRMGSLIPPSPVTSTHPQQPREFDSSEKLSKRVPQRLLLVGHKHMHTLSKKIIRNSNSNGLHRSTSAPDFHAVLSTKTYQASSIHSRKRFTATMRSYFPGSSNDEEGVASRTGSPPPPPPIPQLAGQTPRRSAQETRLLSDLWVTSAATFRRMGKLEQALGAIQEAEVLDEENPNVWVQLGLYYASTKSSALAVESLHKALVIEQDHIGALVHLSQQYLTPPDPPTSVRGEPVSPPKPSSGSVDLAAGLLNGLTQGQGWDVPEAWYFLAKACGLQGRKERERECLIYALKLQETRCIRPLGIAVPRFL